MGGREDVPSLTMRTRVAVIAGAMAAQVAVLSGLVWLSASDTVPRRATRRPAAVRPRVDVLSPGPELPLSSSGWRLVGRLSAHFALVLKVEAENLQEAGMIARELTTPITGKYNEVLIYFYPVDGKDGLPDRRVQWTEAGGYVEVSLR